MHIKYEYMVYMLGQNFILCNVPVTDIYILLGGSKNLEILAQLFSRYCLGVDDKSEHYTVVSSNHVSFYITTSITTKNQGQIVNQ